MGQSYQSQMPGTQTYDSIHHVRNIVCKTEDIHCGFVSHSLGYILLNLSSLLKPFKLDSTHFNTSRGLFTSHKDPVSVQNK